MSRPFARTAVLALAPVMASGGMALDAKPSQTCGPLREVASLEMTALPDGSRVSVPLTINGKPVNLVVDTGAGMSSLTEPAATMLGIRLRDSEAGRLVDKDGAAVHRYYVADSFQLGSLAAKGIAFMQHTDMDDARVGGTMGPDLMARYDVEMDFSERKLTYFSQDHCPGHIVHWSTDAVAQVPIRMTARARDYPPPAINPAAASLSPEFMGFLLSFKSPILGTDIRAQVMLDGHPFMANIDTGLDVSTVNSEAAQAYFNVPLDSSQAPEMLQGQPAQIPARTESVTVTGWRQEHRFHTLTFGGVTVANPLFVLKSGPPDAHRVGAPQSPDITIGMDVLRKLHLYFAFGERMLYVSAASSPVQTDGK
jgi:hypothetical protein